jgi:ABC-type ATPase involved in cell division
MTTNSINPTKPSELLDIAEIAVATDRFLFIVGSGGAGKTSIVTKILAPAMGRKVYYVNLNGQGHKR